MTNEDRDQRTEEATPRRKEKLREDGKVARSQDVVGAVVLVGAMATLTVFGDRGAVALAELAERCFRLSDAHRPLIVVAASLPVLVEAVLPVMAATAVLAAATTMVQTRGLFSPKLVAFKPERLNPLPNLKNVLPGRQSMEELLKQLLKIAALGVVVWRVVEEATPEFAVLPASDPITGAATVGRVAGDVALWGGAAFAAIAAIDYWHARRRFQEESKMSRHDVRQEHKDQEGSPELKQRRRMRMRDLARKRALGGVRAATVLVTNPTHYACALRYEPERDGAPVLLAKGVDDVAFAMRTEARKHGVPIIENRPLARSLWSDGKVGRAIPVELYQLAAEVVAHVMRLRGGAR